MKLRVNLAQSIFLLVSLIHPFLTRYSSYMSFSIYNQVTDSDDHVHKLMQLPKELVEYLKQPENVLQFKSPLSYSNHLVLCTQSTTYLVRQMNHSNTQLLVEDLLAPAIKKSVKSTYGEPDAEPSQDLLAVDQCSYMYELTPTEGSIETAGLPIYDGTTELLSTKNPRTLEQLIDDSPIAADSFTRRWHSMCGCTVNQVAVILHSGFVTEALYALISVTIAEKLHSFTIDGMATRLSQESPKYTRSVLETISGKFCTQTDTLYELNESEIAKWFGVMTLRKLKTPCYDKDVLLQWKSSLPPFFSALLDLKALRGHYYRPMAGSIQQLDPLGLSLDIHGRIKEMFALVKEWDFDEFLPFVLEFIPLTKKPDAVILKYAKKKRVGRRFVVCPR